MNFKTLITDPVEEVFLEKLRGLTEVEVATKLTPEELLKRVADADALIVRSKTKVTREVINSAKRLKIIGRAGVGVDNVDMVAAREKGITVINTPSAPSQAVAELTMGLMLSLARSIPAMDRLMKQGIWEKKNGVELKDKTLGLLGFGNIAQMVSRFAVSVGMEVVCYEKYLDARKKDAGEKSGAKFVEFDELLKRSDFISVHVPLTPETKGMIDKKQFELMKDGVFLINTARGGIIDERALYQFLISGKVAGAALDVYEMEPPAQNDLIRLDKVVATPHIGGSTAEAQRRIVLTLAEDLVRFIKGQKPINIVNYP